LGWPLTTEEIEELTFEYEPEELGIDPQTAVKIREIKQLRPFTGDQPWGIFYISFEPKKLPVVVLRRVLRALVIKKRQTATKPSQAAWSLHDLLFISSYGETDGRAITFAHFSEDEESKLPTLRVVGWDAQDTPLHMDRCISELQKLTFDEELSPDKWRGQWSEAFTLEHREVITTSKALAKKLATLAGRIRKRVNKILAVESEKGPLRQLYKAFQETLVHDLSEDDFADMYAQTITYGLFSTKKSRPAGLVAENLLDMIPRTNPFLKELLSTFLTVGGRKGKIDFDELGIDDVVQTLRNADMDAVLRDFEDRNPLEDPVIHFYEGFLKEYDAKKKVKRGVFYTPRPVVSFIVRSVDEILRKEFGLEYGLADTTTWGEMARRNKDIRIPEGISEQDPFVQILDPAAGTGTFLVAVIDIIRQTMIRKWEKEGHMPLEFGKLWNEYVPKHLLPRLCGFELMMAPYAIAHMKIGLKLAEGPYPYRFGSDERVRIYLTNTLEEPKDFPEYLEEVAKPLALEAKATNIIKKNASSNVIVGNPPYSYMSANLSDDARRLVEPYRFVDGERIREKGAIVFERAIQDDYVKFFAFAQKVFGHMGIGIFGMISNSAYLHNPNMRGMRNYLLRKFSDIFVLDLHGDTKRDGDGDENVFDIKTGVAITVMSKGFVTIEFGDTYRSDILGSRQCKETYLDKNALSKKSFTKLNPQPPQYLFTQSKSEIKYYEDWHSVNDIFGITSVGIKTNRDALVIDYQTEPILERIKLFIDTRISTQKIREVLKVKANSQWNIDSAREKCRETFDAEYFTELAYRPFDTRVIYYHPSVVFNTRPGTMKHMLNHRNLLLLTNRRIRSSHHAHFFVAKLPSMAEMLSSADNCNAYPLYCYAQEGLWSKNKCSKHPNINAKFSEAISLSLKLKYEPTGKRLSKLSIIPEDVFAYIYAIFHSPAYRLSYGEFLVRDFPRVPITSNTELFRSFCTFGENLVSLHLMESDKLNNHITTFPVSGDNAVTKVGEKGKTLADVKNGKGKLYINKTQYFANLPEEVWNFHIGGYQVCYKWLADRKKAGRRLSADDIEHYHKIVVALNETIRIMKEIDEVIDTHGGWPKAFATNRQ
jgi:predicted helicase